LQRAFYARSFIIIKSSSPPFPAGCSFLITADEKTPHFCGVFDFVDLFSWKSQQFFRGNDKVRRSLHVN
jgi:hypothetical protein